MEKADLMQIHSPQILPFRGPGSRERLASGLTGLHPALNIMGSARSSPMRIVSEYRQRAEEYRKLAKLAASAEDSNLFEDMAQKWDMLADLRIGDIEPEDQRTSVPPRRSGTKRFRPIT